VYWDFESITITGSENLEQLRIRLAFLGAVKTIAAYVRMRNESPLRPSYQLEFEQAGINIIHVLDEDDEDEDGIFKYILTDVVVDCIRNPRCKIVIISILFTPCLFVCLFVCLYCLFV